MKRVAGVAAFALCLAVLGFASVWAQGEDSGVEPPEAKREGFTQYREQAKEVASDLICFCPGCDERSVLSECNCSFAYRELGRVEALLSEGKTPEEVVALYVKEHGRFVLAVPPARGFHLVAWGLPFAGMLLGALILWIVLRRITASREEETEPADVETSSTSPELLKRAREELEKYDF
ncbi:MAG: cytochrome c-type biogenesis protein CcmH [Acidobacteriota bacterium]|nr:MAG: cytochrome c-type biogenesis protein CcmH [Acidobacteriota bacterium]